MSTYPEICMCVCTNTHMSVRECLYVHTLIYIVCEKDKFSKVCVLVCSNIFSSLV